MIATEIMEKNNLLYGILEKLRIFFRPFYDNGSYLTAEEGYRPKIYEPIYSKSKNNKEMVKTMITPLLQKQH